MSTNTKTKKSLLKKILLITLSVIGLAVVVGVIFVNSFMQSGKPVTKGKTELAGLENEVKVTRDENGVPHIEAETLKDLYYAQGYVEAQDRMFQMDLSRRMSSGNLSEVFGEMALEQDKYYLTLGLRRAAEISLNEYPEKSLEYLQSFADGVNAYIDEAISKNNLAVEFKLVGYKPKHWEPLDSLTIGKFMAHDLGGNWKPQVFRQYLIETFEYDEAMELFPTYPEGAPTSINDVDLLRQMITSSPDVSTADEQNGSNNWVLSGSKTVSGMPLLADDPHLSIATPSVWYPMNLISKEENMNVSGVIFAGVPGIILGHNEYCAWGVTNTGPDVEDIYIEKINPENDNQYLFKDEWKNVETVHYSIPVKGQENYEYDVRITHHGPIVSDFAAQKAVGSDKVLALRWTALDVTKELQAVFDINKARNWDEFEKGLLNFEAPAQNFVFAAIDGTIAYKANGRIPIRSTGDGLFPVEGWTGENEWAGYIPFDELPRVVNPESGFIATANYKVVGEAYPYHISHMWAQPYRIERITEVLSQDKKFTPEDMMKLQGDVVNKQAELLIPMFLELLKGKTDNEQYNQALTILQNWYDSGCKDETKEAGSLIFSLLQNEIANVLFVDKIPEDMYKMFDGRRNAVDMLIIKEYTEGNSVWFKNAGGFDTVVFKALQNVIDKIQPDQGKDLTKWEYDKFHEVEFSHPLSSQSFLKPFFNPRGRIASPGSQVTVRAASYKYDSGLNNHGASWRFVADLSNLSEARQIVAPGVSGHRASKHYQDQIDRWLNADLYTINIKTFAGDVITLTPTK